MSGYRAVSRTRAGSVHQDVVSWAVEAAGPVGGVIMMHSHTSLAVAALVTWLLAESLGLVMLRSWITSGAARNRRTRPDGMSLPVLLSHAGLALSGFVSWLCFLGTGADIAAWLSVALLAPAIGLGVSTVSVWTPYPVRAAETPVEAGPGLASYPRDAGMPGRSIPDHTLARSLEDEALASKLIDELLAHNLTIEPPTVPRINPRTLVPLVHGVLAIATFLLATLAAIGAA
jgi:hypothetical protein